MNNLTSLIVGALAQGAAALNQPPPPPPPPVVSYQPAVVTVAAPQQPFVVAQPAVMAQPVAIQQAGYPGTGNPQVGVPQTVAQPIVAPGDVTPPSTVSPPSPAVSVATPTVPTSAPATPMTSPSVSVPTAPSRSAARTPPPPPASEPATPPAVPPVELAQGAMCRTYNITLSRGRSHNRNRDHYVNEVLEQVNAGAVALDQAYDAVSLDFSARRVNKHGGNLFVWDGFLVVEHAGTYTFMLSELPRNRRGISFAQIVVNRETGAIARPQDVKTFTANLAKGANAIQLLVYGSNEAPKLEYRLVTSVKPAKKITPSMLYHEVVEEEEW